MPPGEKGQRSPAGWHIPQALRFTDYLAARQLHLVAGQGVYDCGRHKKTDLPAVIPDTARWARHARPDAAAKKSAHTLTIECTVQEKMRAASPAKVFTGTFRRGTIGPPIFSSMASDIIPASTSTSRQKGPLKFLEQADFATARVISDEGRGVVKLTLEKGSICVLFEDHLRGFGPVSHGDWTGSKVALTLQTWLGVGILKSSGAITNAAPKRRWTSTRTTSRSGEQGGAGVSANAVRWPIFRPGRASALPYR